MARPGKSSAAARRSWDFLFGEVSVQGGRASFVPSPFRPRFPVPTSLRRTLLSASLAFQGASGFSRSGTFVLLRPRPCWAPVSLTQFVAARSSVLRGWGAWGRCSGHPVRLVGCACWVWGRCLFPPARLPGRMAAAMRPGGQLYVPAGSTLKW